MTNYEREFLKGSTDCLILSVVNDHPTYGYELIKELESRSDGYFHFREGTLYPALHRMEHDGLLEGKWEKLPGGQERRYYYIMNELLKDETDGGELMADILNISNVNVEAVKIIRDSFRIALEEARTSELPEEIRALVNSQRDGNIS